MPLKAIIIDDELRARTLLQDMIGELTADVEIVATCENLASGVKASRKFNPDIIFYR